MNGREPGCKGTANHSAKTPVPSNYRLRLIIYIMWERALPHNSFHDEGRHRFQQTRFVPQDTGFQIFLDQNERFWIKGRIQIKAVTEECGPIPHCWVTQFMTLP